MNPDTYTHPVILFDGVCNLCNSTVRFLIRNDRRRQFRFASLQSEAGRSLLAQHGLGYDLNSFVLIESGKAYTRSTGALRTLRRLGGAWKLPYLLILLPAFIRDAGYNLIARNRYRLFGRRETCMVPTPELKALFLG